MVGTVCSAGVHGIDAFLVNVECDISEGFPAFDIVGSLAPEVRESKERVSTALKNSGVSIPNKKITVNLSPANVKKHGTGYDLPIAISLLISAGEISVDSIKNTIIIGELMLTGKTSGVRGVLPIVKVARDGGIRRCIVPKENEKEAAVIDDMEVIAVEDLPELIDYLRGIKAIGKTGALGQEFINEKLKSSYDFVNVSGQKVAKRGLEIAAAGLHNVLMIGPPGTGKTMLAKCLPGILPPMNKEESLEVSSIYSVAGMLPPDGQLITKRPVVEAHHTTTDIAMSGGGNTPRPGLISLAHRGVLFLDEMPEFSKSVLEVLRQPIEDKVIHVARNGYNISYPADFMLVGALNPCPCGMFPDIKRCTCTENMRKKYINKLSKPLVDRMDICLQVLRQDSSEILEKKGEESSEEVRKRVINAQRMQQERFARDGILFNSQMGIKEIEKYCVLDEKEKALMEKAITKYELSARSFHRILRCSRTIADMDNSEKIKENHIMEALFFKSDIVR